MKSLLINVKKIIIMINWNSFVKIIIFYAVHVASLKLKKKDMVNTMIVMFIILKK